MAALSEHELHALIVRDPAQGWRTFVDAYTPALLAAIELVGVRDRDEAMELYTLVCERLSADGCARLRRRDPDRGSLRAWLTAVVRNSAVDWVRSRAGRRRLFGVVQQLSWFHQQVFQLYYWQEHTPSEIAGLLSAPSARPVDLLEVLAALDAIHAALNARHYGELMSMTARARAPVSLDVEIDEGRLDPVDPSPSVEADATARERDASIEASLATLPDEDAAIVRLHYFHGLSLADVKRALHLPQLTPARLATIVAALRDALATRLGPPAAGARDMKGSSA